MKKMILLISMALVSLTVGSFFLTRSNAQSKDGSKTPPEKAGKMTDKDKKDSQSKENSDSPQPSEDLDKSFSRLIALAQEKGAVRVIIGLRLDGYKPVGELNEGEREKQKADIKTVQNDFLERLADYNLREVKQFQFIPYLAAEVDAEALEKMRQDPLIVSIDEDEAMFPTLAESVPLVGAPAAWTAGFTGSGWAVAILDTGVDKNHSFLSGKVISEACYSSNFPGNNISSVCPGAVTQSTASNSGLNCSLSISGCNHGTHVAGIAAGTNASFSGVARNANIIAVQVFSRFGNQTDCGSSAAPCALTFPSDQMLGLERVLALSSSTNIAAVNMSLGGGGFTSNCDSNPLKPAIDNLRSVGIATVIASGNNSFTNAISAPACISTAVSVGSTGDGSSGATQDQVVSDSNSASFLNLLAPGRWINSSVPGGGFSNFTGTSMATPHVAGAWAILKQKKPTATVTEILNAFTSTGLAVTDSRNGIVKRRIRVDSALAAISPACTSAPISMGQTIGGNLQSGDCLYTDGSYYDAYTFSGTAGQQIFITLNSTQFNAFLFLFQGNYPGGTQLASNNDGGGGTNARIPATSGFLTLPATGTYTILANSLNVGETGSYSLFLGNNTSCSYQLDPTSRSFAAAGGSTSFSVVTQTGCSWTATVNAPLLELVPPLQSKDFLLLDANFSADRTVNSQVSPQAVFLNSTPITINDRTANSNPPATASLYPSSITVSGMTGTITQVEASLNSLSHTFPDDVDVILVGPGGQRAILMSDVGGDPNLSGVNLTFNQSAAAQLPDNTQVTSGTYRPTNFGGNTTIEPGGADNFPSPGPGQNNYTADLSVFNGTSANGTWQLYVVDDENVDSGNIATGWALGITTSGGTSWINITSGSGGTGNGTVNYSVAANSGTSQRTGTITVNGQVHTVTQSGTNPCTYSMSTNSNSVSPGTGSTNFNMTAPSGCTWSAVSNSPSWLTTSSSGSGNGTISYSYTANTSTSPRSGTITAGGQVHTVTQIGVGGAGSVQFSSAAYTVNENGGTATITVTRTGGTGTGTVNYSTSNGTATVGTDYTSTSGTLLFTASTASLTFNVPILDDAAVEGNETINLALGNVSTSLTLGTPNTAVLTIIDNESAPPSSRKPFDFDGDSKTDISIFRPASGQWWINRSSTGQTIALQFGLSTDKPVPADYTGDGKTDIAFWRPSTGFWFIVRSEDSSFYSVPFGAAGDIPAPGDFDGDGKADPAVYRPSAGTWYISKSTGGTTIQQFGIAEDKPVVADYDGDGKTDIAIFRPSDGSWWYFRSSDSQFRVFRFGLGTDRPVQGDYTGDGKADIAVFRPSTGVWFILRSEDSSFYSVPFGTSGDLPAPGDYDGDGRFDTAVFRPSNANWYVQRSTAGTLIQQFGANGDLPLPGAFVP